MLKREKQESQRRGDPLRQLLFTLIFIMTMYMCHQLRRGSLARFLAATKQARAIVVKQVEKQNVSENHTAWTAAQVSFTAFSNETGDRARGQEWNSTRAHAESGRQEKP
mmetsp:Transcript_3846/g.8635  ORF Transcript_3846/g.8635 Transcript_3846/m.8635 type:complete len:109 (-) Transcript_3846:464-790(-)